MAEEEDSSIFPIPLGLKWAWNNFRWRKSNKFSYSYTGSEKSVVVLGKKYLLPQDELLLSADFKARIWMSYRKDFPTTLPGSSIRTDCGWGCMLRSGQMLLAQAFILHFLGRDTKWHKNETYIRVVKLFSDVSRGYQQHAPFGVHRLVELSSKKGKKAGDWFGPACVAHLMKDALCLSTSSHSLRLYVAQDCTVFLGDVDALCSEEEVAEATEVDHSRRRDSARAEWKGSLVLCIPLRLGGERINPVYFDALKAFLGRENCLGVIGGKPKHSLYFFGYHDDELLCLDPHFVQPASEVSSVADLASYRCENPRRVKFDQMDPSCCVGFYCRTRRELEELVRASEEWLVGDYPLFVFKQGSSSTSCLYPYSSLLPPEERILTVARRRFVNANGEIEELESAQEDFVFI